jgi:23S rRNA (pseudouridine1915-N3)-methyltransferase
MNIELIVVGKTDSKEVAALVDMYLKRINFYNRFNITYIPDIRNAKNLSEAQQKSSEGEAILRLLDDSDRVVLLDEKGQEFRSIEYAEWLQKRMNSGVKRLVFIIGGPYAFSDAVYKRANEKISLSKMTFSHQIIRAIFTEQLYRAFSIINNSPYHHESGL